MLFVSFCFQCASEKVVRSALCPILLAILELTFLESAMEQGILRFYLKMQAWPRAFCNYS